MILFVFEGRKTEPSLFKTLEHLYFKNPNEQKICCFGYTIYELYKLMNESDFKNYITKAYDFYKSTDFMQFPMDKKLNKLRPITAALEKTVKENWGYLKEQNIKKANYICCGINDYPENKAVVNQKNILDSQLEKYVLPGNEVSILNAFPLFLFEYFK
ncbi:MAG: hypothetical protein K6A89_09375 [Treponema sp.]|nr:hypothetical protein [Treponema sp.]